MHRLLASLRTAAVLACLSGLACASAAAPSGTDGLTFGDRASEQAHAFTGMACPAVTGVLGRPCRRIGPGGALVFSLACDPERQNYRTAQFWGRDRNVATLFLYNGAKRIGLYGDMWPELDLNTGEAALPGRFYYATYMLPREMTRRRHEVAHCAFS